MVITAQMSTNQEYVCTPAEGEITFARVNWRNISIALIDRKAALGVLSENITSTSDSTSLSRHGRESPVYMLLS